MKPVQAHNLACPIDHAPLGRRDAQWVCENGHAFDIARQGYVNLLPVQHKRSRQPGDSKAMVAARRRFLDAGAYAPVADRLASIAAAHVDDTKPACLLDAGCGEGYYLDVMLDHLARQPGPGELACIGLDISKPAIVESAKRNRRISWVVGTNRQPPLARASVDGIVCVFGFHSFDGFGAILKPGGWLILVEPGPDHLKELREVIYTDVKKTPPPDLSDAERAGFTLRDEQSLRYTTDVMDRSMIGDLLLMTPHFYRAGKQGREAAARLDRLAATVDVVFRVLGHDGRGRAS